MRCKYSRGVACICFFFFKQKTAYEIKECDWSSDVCSSDLHENVQPDNAMSILSEPASARLVHEPHPFEHRLIFKNIGRKNWKVDIDTYLEAGGYEDLKKAIKMSPAEIVNEVKTSGLRGRAIPR